MSLEYWGRVIASNAGELRREGERSKTKQSRQELRAHVLSRDHSSNIKINIWKEKEMIIQ